MVHIKSLSEPGVSVKSYITTAITPSQLPLSLVHEDHEDSLYKYDIGTNTQMVNPKPEKVLLMVGATRAGKAELVNGIANFMLEVNWNDNTRFKVVSREGTLSQAHSQTRSITAYSFHFAHMPFVLTIIDTPGFGSAGGIEKDKRIAGQIKKFFARKDRGGIDQLHGIGFVNQSPIAKATPTQKYIFDEIVSIFGKPVISNGYVR